MYEQEIAVIKEYFSRKCLHAVPSWIEGCAEFFVSTHRNYSCNELQEFAFDQWKLSDLREMGSGCLPPNTSTALKTVLPGKYAIQVEWVRDIGCASYAQMKKVRQIGSSNEDIGSTKPQSWEPRQSRMIQMEISDGLQSIQAIEYKHISALDLSICPGSKALIIGPVECRRGMLLLQAHNIQIIGGEVDSIIICNAYENILARILGLPLNPYPNINLNTVNAAETQGNSLKNENKTRVTQQIPAPNTVRSVPVTNSLSCGIVANGEQSLSRSTIDNSSDLLNEEELLGDNILAQLSALENEVLSKKEPIEAYGNFHDNAEKQINVSNNILHKKPKLQMAGESSMSLNSSVNGNEKNMKKVTFDVTQHKSQVTSQKKITSINGKPKSVKQLPSSSGQDDFVLSTDFPEMGNTEMFDSALDSEFLVDYQEPSCSTFNKSSNPNKLNTELLNKKSSEEFSGSLNTKFASIVISGAPFVYLKQIKSDINIPKTYRLKVFILTLISELELIGNEWVLYAKVCDGTANLDVQLSSNVMEKLLNLPKEKLMMWKPHIQTNKDVREELKMMMKTAEHRLIHFNNLVDIRIEPGQKMPCVTAVYEVSSEDLQALKLRLSDVREKCLPKP